jgi:predicted CoA-substrate-specific enzyme activase
MACVGVNIGALTVKAVALLANHKAAQVQPHLGRPSEVLQGILAAPEFANAGFFGVSGHLGHLSEVAAIQRVLQALDADFDALVSLGGESFLVYLLTGKRITQVLSHNKCAAGSGEFFAQQIGRMGLDLGTAISRSFAGSVVPLASRCSVHCKSDITHKLNRHEATPEDILHTLLDSMAGKVIALLEKGQRQLKRVLLIGGMTRNAALLAALRGQQPGTEFVVLPESPWFEAWGAALLTRDEPLYRSPKLSAPPGLGQLPPLHHYADRVEAIPVPPRPSPRDVPLVLGVDAGSTTTKAVLLDPATRGMVATHYARTRGDPVAAARECLQALVRQAGNRRVRLVATTGSARELVGAYLGTKHVFNEISAQAAGASHFDAGVDTIFEIGGQDAKYILLRNGVPIDYAMNNACSAGTGSFLEESAQGDLGLAVSDIAGLALAAPAPVQFKATCAAFINSDIRLAQQEGHSRENIVAGLVYAIAANYLTKVKGQRPAGKKIFLQGGVALNHALGAAFAQCVGRPVVIPPHPELLGALGVALLALDRTKTESPNHSASEDADRRPPGTAHRGPSKSEDEREHEDDPSAAKSGQREATADAGTELLTLEAPELKLVSRFTCRACKLYCSIDRFEVAGRRFPFGGRCSLYENAWKRKARTAAAPDLVAQRTDLLFGGAQNIPQGPGGRAARPRVPFSGTAQDIPQGGSLHLNIPKWRPAVATPPSMLPGAGDLRIGIPKALTTHSLHPLYATFFSSLGLEAVLSEVDPRGESKANAGFCFPAQIAHGAVLELQKRGLKLVFLPHVIRMPQADDCRDSYLCPITQAGPYFLAKAFPEIRFLSPMLDFTEGYAACPALVELAVRELGIPRPQAEQAWLAAVRVQTEMESALRLMGQAALARAVAEGKPAILLAGHSYNAFSPEASQSVGKKLSSMGIPVIPADCLAPVEPGPTAWHFANQILNAAALARQHPNLFLLCVSNFSCTIDAFTQAMISSQLGAKPWLTIEIDAHTADAGAQTRLEAFLDIVQNYQAGETGRPQPFIPCRLTTGGRVQRSQGDLVALTDPRARIVIPNFSQIHTQALAMVARWSGLHPAAVMPLERAQVDRGLQHTSGRECLPLPICLGQLLQAVDRRQPGEIIGFFMVRGGAPCVVDSYLGYFERFLAEQRLPDVFLFDPRADNDYGGFDLPALTRALSAAIPVADILVEMECVLRVVSSDGGGRQLVQAWERLAATTVSLAQFQAQLPAFIDQLTALPRTRDPLGCPRIAVTGDFFTRFSPFFMEGIAELYARHGIIVKPVDVSDLLLYAAYQGVAGAASDWGMKPGAGAFAKACTRILQPDGKAYLQHWLNYRMEHKSDTYYRGLFRRTGLLVGGANEIPVLFEKASEHVSPALYGEVIPTVGKGLEAAGEGYDGLIVIGPFNCLPYRISEAVLKPLSIQQGMPILTYESDGYAVSPSFIRQVEVHIQQVLDRAAKNRLQPPAATNGLAALFRSALASLRPENQP